jgi:heme-degrading monooxygenase HmoA
MNNASIHAGTSGETSMIARHWRGWTKAQDADAYETLLKTQVLPELAKIAGYRGGYVLRGNAADEVEFVVVNLFDSIEAVRAFAGPDYSVPVFEPEARLLLSRIETVAHHYEVRASTV